MLRHFKLTMFILGFILAAVVIIFLGSLYVDACSYRTGCLVSGRAKAAHTPIPTLISATLPADITFPSDTSPENCTVTAQVLLSAWVKAGHPETDPFPFTDANNVDCQATFADVQNLFSQANLWYAGALACTSCHNDALSPESSAGLDLSSYAGAMAGSQRTQGSKTGMDILGGGNWQKSKLNQVLFVLHQEPNGIPQGAASDTGPTILAGIPLSVANATPMATPSAPEVARPNTEGDAGPAINLTGDPVAGKKIYLDNCQMCHGQDGKGNIMNPGSDDGTVPPLNPIDETLKDQDYHTYAYNLDLFLQNGSRPSGPNPSRFMPPWGTGNGLTQQQIADVIAFIIGLNK